MTEAIGFGRPVIATAVGGASEWIADGVNGFLCPVAEEGLLIGTLKRALEERHRWKDMGLAAHRKIKKNWIHARRGCFSRRCSRRAWTKALKN